MAEVLYQWVVEMMLVRLLSELRISRLAVPRYTVGVSNERKHGK